MDLSRRLIPVAEAGPLLLGPVLAAVASAIILSFFGPVSLLPLAVLAVLAVSVWAGLLRFDLPFSLFLFYMLFETTVAGFLPGSLGMVSKDLFYLTVAALGLFIAAATASRVESLGPPRGTAAIVLYMLLFLLLALRGPTLFMGLLGFRGSAFLALVAVLTPLAYRKRGARKTSLVILALGLSAVAAIGIVEFFFWQEVREGLQLQEQRWTMGTLKATSTVGSPGAYGALMALGLLFLLARALEGKLRLRAWLVGLPMSGLWFAGLVLSFSRISQLGFVVAGFALLLRRPRLILPGAAALILVAMLANALTGGFLFGNLLATIGVGEHLDAIQSTVDRVEIVRETLQDRVPEHPWFGFGLGTAGAATREHIESAPFGYLFLDNMYLKMILEGGVVGLLAYGGMLLGLMIAGVRIGRGLTRRFAGIRLAESRAWVSAAAAGLLFFTLSGIASTVHEMPVINASIWWCAGWILWGGDLLRENASEAASSPPASRD